MLIGFLLPCLHYPQLVFHQLSQQSNQPLSSSNRKLAPIDWRSRFHTSCPAILPATTTPCIQVSAPFAVLSKNLLQRFYQWDIENNFDEIKNQWGWGGFVTRQLQTSQIMARTVALIYNWWNLFVRLAIPEKHHEAISSRPLLLSSVGRLTESGRQRRMVITSTHAQRALIQRAYTRIHDFFSWLKATAPQLTPQACWQLIVTKSMEVFMGRHPPQALPLATG